MKKYGFEIKVDGEWHSVSPPSGPPPYAFDTELGAWTIARVRYPVLVRLANEGNKELIRITVKETVDRPST